MSTRVFISYRRSDSAGWAGRIADRISARFGADSVFLDVDKIAPGSDFESVINERLGAVTATLVLIGPDWLNMTGSDGRRRLDDPDDHVRGEIVLAMAGPQAVIPVLVDGATMPSVADLPDDLQPLVRRNAMVLHEDEFAASIERLLGAIGGEKPPLADRGRSRRWIFAGAGTIVAAAALLIWRADHGGDSTAATTVPSAATTAPTTETTKVAEASPTSIGGVVKYVTSSGRPVDISLTGAVVTLTRIDQQGAPPAVVSAAADQRFLFSDLDAGTSYRITSSQPGWADATVTATAEAGHDGAVELVMHSTDGQLSGSVVDDTGASIGGATVTVTDGFNAARTLRTTTVGTIGSFHFDRIEAPNQLQVTVELAGYTTQILPVELTSGEDLRDVSIVLRREASPP